MNDAALKALREALAHLPDNAPLWRHLCETLLSMGRFDEAEREFRLAHGISAVAHNHDDHLRRESPRGLNHLAQHRHARDVGQHLGSVRLHARRLAGSKNDHFEHARNLASQSELARRD